MSTIFHRIKKLPENYSIALQQSEFLHAEFITEMAAFDLAMILWIDEIGCDCRNALLHHLIIVGLSQTYNHNIKHIVYTHHYHHDDQQCSR